MEGPDGIRVKIPSSKEEIAFCGEDSLNDTLDAPTELAFPVKHCYNFNPVKHDTT